MKTGIETELAIVAFSSHLASVAPFPACKLRPNSFLAKKNVLLTCQFIKFKLVTKPFL